MKRNLLQYLIIASLYVYFPLHAKKRIKKIAKNPQPTIAAVTEQKKPENDPALLFMQPIELDEKGINFFISRVYNHPFYASDFLPNNFTHLIQFLEKGTETGQKRAYTQSIFHLFSNKLKSTHYINAYAFNDLLSMMPPIIQHNFIPLHTNTRSLEHDINNMLYNKFLTQYPSFKKNPNDFLQQLSHDIVQSFETSSTKDTESIEIEELRKTVLVFLETCLGKLIWCPEDKEQTWHSVKTIAQQLTTFSEQKIVPNQDDLNALFRTLLERYCYFIDIAGHQFSESFYDYIKQDIYTNPTNFLTLSEEDGVTSKSQRLLLALDEGKVSAMHAQQKNK